jgi:DNA-binding winged helix-turn-helix (wHTH) protein/tetratricopeptide (TPR) repeat protein
MFGPFRLDSSERLLTRDGSAVPLPPKCFDLLLLLVGSAGRLLEKDTIIESLWPNTFVEEANISNLIGALRKALGDTTRTPQYIQTVSKRGYRFIARVSDSEREDVKNRVAVAGSGAIRIIAFPFRSQDSEPDLQFLGHSLPEAISSSLAELNAFTVRPCQLASRFDPVRWDPKAVAADLDVDAILTGTLVRSQDRLQITTQLIDAAEAEVSWSKVWDIASDDLLQLHNGIVQLLIRTLLQRTEAPAPSSLPKHAPSDPCAYELYLRANHLMRTRMPENVALARDLYLACTQKDPEFAPAWSSLGRCYRFLEKFHVEQGGHAEQSAEAAFQQAFRFNPHLAIAHCAYTTFECDKGHAVDAMVRLLREVELNPNNPELFAGLVHACRYCGQLEASLAAHERARRLDRNAVTSVAHTYFSLGEDEKTLYWYGTGAGLYLDALALACSGRQSEASALVWTRRDRFGMQPALMISLHAHLNGDSARGIAALRQAVKEPQDPEITFYMARHAAAFGELDFANELLSESVTRGYFSCFVLMNDPWLGFLRETPSFQQTLSRAQALENRARQAFDEANGRTILGLGSK